jgi:hypothetical protein
MLHARLNYDGTFHPSVKRARVLGPYLRVMFAKYPVAEIASLFADPARVAMLMDLAKGRCVLCAWRSFPEPHCKAASNQCAGCYHPLPRHGSRVSGDLLSPLQFVQSSRDLLGVGPRRRIPGQHTKDQRIQLRRYQRGKVWLPCAENSGSRKTGYKIVDRYEECGWEGLPDRARRPHRYANQLPEQLEAAIVAAKREKPSWGARTIRERLLRRFALGS